VFLKKISAIVVLSVFVLSQIGHQLVFELAKWDAKTIIAQNIKTNKYQGVVEKISETSLMSWEEKDHEFELNGQMYDVVKKEVKGQRIVYYAINDSKESNLLEVYNLPNHTQFSRTPIFRNAIGKTPMNNKRQFLFKHFFFCNFPNELRIGRKHSF
jgi:mRNA-degrading endonuclease YafQ of YafQ-DinJ toxin-antitoxin module